MRWCWIDRFLDVRRGQYAVAVKNVTNGEDHIFDYVSGLSVLPNTLVIEGMAQTAGVLLGELNQYRERIVLAKVARAVFHEYAYAGDTLTYRMELKRVDDMGAFAEGVSYIGDRLQAEVELFFAHLDERIPGKENFAPADLVQLLRLMRFYEVAKDEHGQPLEIPAHLLEAERAAYTQP